MTLEQLEKMLAECSLNDIYKIFKDASENDIRKVFLAMLSKSENRNNETEEAIFKEKFQTLWKNLYIQGFFKFIKLISDPSKNPPIKAYSEDYETVLLNSPFRGINAFQYLAQHAPYQLYRYAMDGKMQSEHEPWSVYEEHFENPDPNDKYMPKEMIDLSLLFDQINEGEKARKGVFRWEYREPGSLKGVLNAYAATLPIAINPHIRINATDIANIHHIAVSDVKGLIPEAYEKGLRKTSHTPNVEDQENEENDTFSICFDVNHTTSSIKGIIQLIDRSGKRPPYFAIDLNTKDNQKVEEFLENDLIKRFYQLYQQKFLIVGYHPDFTKEKTSIQDIVEHRLNDFYLELDTAESEDSKLLAIVKVVQDLEHIHPVIDANIRSLCMVMLNILLMQQGFLPTIMDDPNQFDGYAADELVNLVKQGMEKTHRLCLFVQKKIELKEQEDGPDIEIFTVIAERQAKLSEFATNLTQALNALSPENNATPPSPEETLINPGKMPCSFLPDPKNKGNSTENDLQNQETLFHPGHRSG